jgi:hypothetical protein
MDSDELPGTAIHEAAHAIISHLVGETFVFVEVTDAQSGLMQPHHSPCPVCGASVQEARACSACLEHYEKNNPVHDGHSEQISRAYRIEAAVAAAGEIAEREFNGGELLANEEEVEWDRDRVATRASLRHLWSHDACSRYCGSESECLTCVTSADELRTNVRSLLLESLIWKAVTELAEQLLTTQRMSGDDVVTFLKARGIGFGSTSIDILWPPLYR